MNRYTLEQKIAVAISNNKSGNEKLEQILTAVDTYSSALLQQTPCIMPFEYLVQLVNKEYKVADELTDTLLKKIHFENIRSIHRIMRVIIDEKQISTQ